MFAHRMHLLLTPLVACLLIAPPVTGSAQDVTRTGATSRQDEARRTVAEVIAAAADEEWRDLDPENTLYMELPTGRVVLELAPELAPRHVENIKALVRGGYYDGGAVRRSQDNYVVQWAIRPLAEGEELPSHIASALPPEFEVPGEGLPFTPMPDGDVYAPEVGFVRGFPAGRDPQSGAAWMAHCYGVVGVPRGNDPDSGSGTGLYAVNGHSPRHLDRNVTMVGRVVVGMEHLSTLPRGTESLGFYASREEWVVLQTVRLASDLPPGERVGQQVLRTDSGSFRDLIMAARSRTEDWFAYPSDRIGLCNVRVPNRPVSAPPPDGAS
jgi:peptidylprolyl isomerase